jgi:hypothetical protein
MTNRGVQAANAGADIVSLVPTRKAVYRRGDTEQPERVGPASAGSGSVAPDPGAAFDRPNA